MKWEYKMHYIMKRYGAPINGVRRPDADLLSRLGADGWELIAIYDNVLYFKRPIEERGEEEVTWYEEWKEALHGEEKAALEEEENQEDKGEPERTAHCPSACPICFSNFKCPLGYSS